MELNRDLRQRDLERLEAEYEGIELGDLQGAQRIHGAVVRSAIRAGWITGVTVDDVADMRAADVRRMARQVNALYEELVNVDPL